MLGKKTIKTYMIVLLAVITILFCCGAQSNVSVNFTFDMKSSVVLTVESNLSESDFSTAIKKNIDGINLVSGDDDILKLGKITKIANGYEVSIKLRRIDKVKAIGEFDYADLNKFLIEGSERRRLIENWSNGVWRYSGSAVISGERGHVDITRDHDGKQEVIPQTANGEKVAFDKFVSDNLENKNLKLFSFFMPALDRTIGEVTSLTFRIDGKIAYFAGNGIEKIDDNTVKLTPKTIKADVTQKDESGEFITELNTDISVAYGYVVFSQGLSPVAVALIIIAALIVFGLITYMFFSLYTSGKKRRVQMINENKNFDVENKIEAEKKARNERLLKKNNISIGLNCFFTGKTWASIKKYKLMYLIILPAFVFIAVFSYAPMFGLVIAFQDYKLLEGVGGSEWVGFKTFYNLLANPDTSTYRYLRNTLYISVIRIGTNFPMILLFALLLREIKSNRRRSVMQTISYIPNFISWVAVSGIAYNLFSKYGGLFNRLIEAFGGATVDFYTLEDQWWWILAFSSLWKGMGWCTLIYMSAMGTIDGELYDACLIDGGGRWHQAMVVTIPGLSNVIAIQLLLDSASILGDSADQIMAMTNGATIGKLNVIGTSMIANITSGGNFSLSTALGLVQGIVGLFMVFLTNSLVKKTENEGIL